MKFAFILLSITFLFSCGTSKKVKGDGEGQTIKMKSTSEIKPAVLGFTKEINDQLQPVKIESASIEGNTLTLTISYSGGCVDNTFEFQGSTSISKSLPAIRPCLLLRKGSVDNCKALIKRELKFDISELAYKKEAGNEIMLTIDGYEGKLSYKFM